MKTTIDLPEALLAEARNAAARHGWMLKTVFEESLRRFLDADASIPTPQPFRLKHSIVYGETAPSLTFTEMLEISAREL